MGGQRVGRYVIEGELGRGGMAVVYLAHQLGLERKVALKELSAFHAQEASYAQRFLHESRLAGSLNHANIVTVFDYFEHEGVPYISMELVERGPLRGYLGKMTPPQIFGVLEGLLAGLGAAHARGVVHRDLKPENVMVTWEGRVKIADFGIAKALDQVVSVGFSTGTGGVVGTPAYMAPEQAVDGEIGPWSDLYSLGVMAYEMLVGRLPFESGDTPLKVLMRHAVEPVPPPLEIRPDLEPYFAWWIERLLAKDASGRFASAAEAWEALERGVTPVLGPEWRREAPLVSASEKAKPPTTAPVTVIPPASRREMPLPTPESPKPRVPRVTVGGIRRTLATPLTLAVGGVVGIVLALVFLLPGGDPDSGGAQRIEKVATTADNVAHEAEVSRICDALQDDREDLRARQRKLKRALRRADTVREQRNALLTEYKHLLSVSNQLIPRLEALRLSNERLEHIRRAALNAWRRNIKRLKARRDALNEVQTFEELVAAATVNNRAAIEDDGVRLNRRLIQLAPQDCEIGVAPSGPIITLEPPPEATPSADPEVAPDTGTIRTPVPTADPGDIGPGDGGDVAPQPGAGGDVSPPAPQPMVAPEPEPRQPTVPEDDGQE